MASIIDAVRNFSNDKFFLPKLLVLLFPMLLLYFIGGGIERFPAMFYTIVFFYLGYIIITFHNTLKEREIYFPNPLTNIVNVFLRGFVGLLCISPITAGAFFAILFFENMNTIVQIKYFAIIATAFVWFTIAMLQLLLYAKDYAPFQAFNFKTIMEIGGEFFLKIFMFLFQSIFAILLPAYIVYLAGNSAFSQDMKSLVVFLYSLYAFTTLMYYLIGIDVLLQISDELIITKEDKELINY